MRKFTAQEIQQEKRRYHNVFVLMASTLEVYDIYTLTETARAAHGEFRNYADRLSLATRWMKMGLVQCTVNPPGRWMLAPDFLLGELLLDIPTGGVKSMLKAMKEFLDQSAATTPISHRLSIALARHAQGRNIDSTDWRIFRFAPTQQHLIQLTRHMMHTPGWEEPALRLVGADPQTYMQKYLDDLKLEMEIPDKKDMIHYFLCNSHVLREEDQRYICEVRGLVEFVYQGQTEVLKEVPTDTPTGLGSAVMAVYQLYQGDTEEALRLFGPYVGTKLTEEALAQRDTMLMWYYVLALKYSQTDNARSRMKHILNLKSADTLHLKLMAEYAMNRTPEVTRRHIVVNHGDMTSLQLALASLTLRYFGGDEHPGDVFETAERMVHASRLTLLQMELLMTNISTRTRGEYTNQALGLTSVLKGGIEPKEEWEKVLDELNEMLRVQPAKSVTATGQKDTTDTRIVYMLADGHFTPKLQKLSKSGNSWSKGRSIALESMLKEMPEMNDTDRQVADLITESRQGWYVRTYALNSKRVFLVLAGYPLVFDGKHPTVPISIQREELQMSVTRLADGSFSIHTNVDMTDDYAENIAVIRENDQLYRVVELSQQQQKVLKKLAKAKVLPVRAEEKLTTFVEGMSRDTAVISDLMISSNIELVEGDTLMTVRLLPVGNGLKAEIFVKPLVHTPPYCTPCAGAEVVTGNRDGQQVQARRHMQQERTHSDAVRRVLERIATSEPANNVYLTEDLETSLEMLDALQNLSEHCRVEWPEGARFRITRQVVPGSVHINVKSHGKWFDVDGEVQIAPGMAMRIQELLERIHEGNGRFIKLGDDEFASISAQLRQQLQALEAMTQTDRQQMRLSPFSTQAIDALQQAGIDLKADEQYQQLTQRIRQAEETPFTVPTGLKAELREYQLQGVSWMARLAGWGAGACLADDMGLGKTLQAITLMLNRAAQGPSLVIMPASVLLNWQSEITRFAPSLHTIILNAQGTDRQQAVTHAGNADVILATYGILVTEQELLAGRQWNMVVLDEAHTIKNRDTKMSHAAMQLQADFRLMLTGTPLQNHLGEIWNLFQFANPGLLGSAMQFQEKFITPIERDQDRQRQKQLSRMLRPFILRRTKDEVLAELPEKSEITLHVDLSSEEMALYEHIRQEALQNMQQEGTPMQALAEITRLRQAACNPSLVQPGIGIPSTKMQTLMDMVERLMQGGHRALVFSQFTSHLALIRAQLDARGIDYLYMDGASSATVRQRLVQSFQQGTQPLFLISLKAGGTGLNLTAADYVFHMDPWWNPAIEDQASDRTYRIGQTRPVTIYRLIASHTIEERIIELHRTKKSLADALLEGSNVSHRLTREEMMELIRN